MRRKRLVWKLFPVYFLITLVSVSIVSLYALGGLREFYHSQVEAGLETQARMVRRWILDRRLFPDKPAALNAEVRSLDACCGTRITVVLPSGKVVADSEFDPAKMENHRYRPEFRLALAGRTGRSRRLSPTLGIPMVYVAIPVKMNGRLIGALRTSLAANAVDARPSALYDRILIGTLLVAMVAGLASLIAARRISEPLRLITEAAARFARGDLGARARPPDTRELASLADTLNAMASQLDSQVKTIKQQVGEQQAILSSMAEGVVAVDNDDRIILLNPSAESLLGITLEQARGRTVQEAVRNPSIQRLLTGSRDSEGPVYTEVILRAPEERIVQAVGTALVDAAGHKIGSLAVLNDITRTRQLENVRRDFVANASHELRTPITSIRASLETLSQVPGHDEKKNQELVEIAARQAMRLHAIVDDLLMLSEMEQKDEASEIPVAPTRIYEVLQSALADCRAEAEANGLEMKLDCDESLEASANRRLLRQAVLNLLDNAVKYSPGGRVTLTAQRSGDELAIRVSDTGCGIEPEHIPRLFERFYRVDKARSRKLGGTGLGLAIVKHIVQAHHGRIEVESTPGKGSTFTIVLPVG